MKHVLAFLACLFALPAAAGTLKTTPINGPFQLAAKQAWMSACVAVIPPFDVYAATTGPASLQVRRYLDKGCVYAVGIAAPLPVHALAQDQQCVAKGYCGDQGTPDQTPFMALRVILTDTSSAPNTVTALVLTQDPPDPPPWPPGGAANSPELQR